eukprot:gene7598-10347_t
MSKESLLYTDFTSIKHSEPKHIEKLTFSLFSEKYDNNLAYCNAFEECINKFLSNIVLSSGSGMPHNALLLCVSGGSDSMAMLHVLARVKQRFHPGLTLEVINFNHKLRIESDEEAEFVRHWCNSYNLTFHERILPQELRVERGLQDTARKWRRSESQFLLESREELKHGLIATAHNSDDQIESFFMKLLRGVHLSRLQLMKSKEEPFVKPLLSLSKDQLRDYLIALNYDWREDSSNLLRKYKRNKVRLDLVPILVDLAGGKDALLRRIEELSDQSHDLQSWITRLSQDKESQVSERSLRVSSLVEKPRMVISEIVNNWIMQQLGIQLSYSLIMRIVALIETPLSFSVVRKSLTVTGDWDVSRYGDEIQLKPRNQSEFDSKPELEYSTLTKPLEISNGSNCTIICSYPKDAILSIKRSMSDDDCAEQDSKSIIQAGFSSNYFDESKRLFLIVRPVDLKNDIIRPIEKNYTSKLSSFLKQQKVSLNEREKTIVLALQNQNNENESRRNEVVAVLLPETIALSKSFHRNSGVKFTVQVNICVSWNFE